jgi:YbgC/YbaW family acyl-CoA thioester hydrolase
VEVIPSSLDRAVATGTPAYAIPRGAQRGQGPIWMSARVVTLATFSFTTRTPEDPIDTTLGRHPVSVSIPVAWGEMDAFQHVNNVVYVRWLETARMVYFERIGLVDRVRDEGVGPILARTAIDYRRPVKYPDTVHVSATVTRIGGSSFTMAFGMTTAA